jgi:2-polyprenyl-6-methoxyphenol hydroxylase-like FAD-dependent oxidoreductase
VHDVIVVGARVAGASTALLLARKGLKVLLLDRVTFPSDCLSSHQVQVPGGAALKRWGLLDAVIAAGTPPTREVRMDAGHVSLAGRFPSFEGVDALYSPRRRILDKILVDAARAAGAEVHEDLVVEALTLAGGSVTGIHGRTRGGTAVRETARLVVGADGKHSLVAKTVGAPKYHERPALAIGYYAYWRGLPTGGGEMYTRDRRSVGVWPTNDGLVVTFVSAPREDFAGFRSDIEGSFFRTFDQAGSLGERLRAAERVEPFRGSADLPNWFRKPFGPGWALVGDAGLVMDPITGQGIAQAFADAELLSDAVYGALDGSGNLDTRLSEYQRKRDRRALPVYELTVELASFHPPTVEREVLLRSLPGRPDEIERLFGLLAGVETLASYRTPLHAFKLLGLGGIARVFWSRCVPPRRRRAG